MSEVEVRDLSVETIDHQLGQLRDLNLIGPLRYDHTVTLDFRLDSDPDPVASAVFAQAMLSVRDDMVFVVNLPDKDEMLRSLVRSGVASALASRGEHVRWEHTPDPFPVHDLWHTWTPGAHKSMAPMFAPEESSDSLFGPNHAVFVNPHLTTDPYGNASVTPLVSRWLTQVVAPDLGEGEQTRFIAAPVFAINELVHNVREHAIMPFNRSFVDSVVALEVRTRGEHRDLRVTVLDTGAGIVPTLRPKLMIPQDQISDGDLLTELLHGNLPGWDRGRGFGLSTIAARALAQECASLHLWTGGTRVRIDTEVEVGAAAEVAGTVINASFPLPTK